MRNYVEEVLFLTGAHGREGERGLIKNFGAEPELEAFCYGKGHHSRLKEVAIIHLQAEKRKADDDGWISIFCQKVWRISRL